MRARCSLLLVTVLFVVTSSDRIACPDGCTGRDESPAHATTADVSACTVCQGWNGPAHPIEPAMLTRVSVVSPMKPEAEQPPHLPTVDPPPKHR